MASGSKREKLKALVRKPFSSKKDKAMSNDQPGGEATTSLTTGFSHLAVDESSPRISAPNILVSQSSPREPFRAQRTRLCPVVNVQSLKPTTPLVVGFSNVPVSEPSAGTSASELLVSESSIQAPRILASASGGFFPNASHFSVKKSVMVDNSPNAVVNIHGTNDRTKAMEGLVEHIIQGADHDSSDRDPPPRCHPGTRYEINKHIITWFYDPHKKELLIWVFGPAGVGKSAIMQTLAEKLAESKHLGASVFVSRPNGRNASRKLFMTISYQLAVHIDDYRTYITEKLSRDPSLVNKGMEEQFKIFIVEPFVEKKIGAGGAPWGILLDGLDELDEHQSQRKIIHLISNFVLEHPDVPLLWAIASRPEPHIRDTFDEEKVVSAHQREYVPANSKESRRDVERFLRDSLERIQGDFPRTVPKKWPSEDQFSHLVTAASGLFAFANTAIRYIEDPRYANPPMRLRQVLSALGGVTAISHNQPFASLDALYTSILDSVPSDVWPITKRVLGTLLYAQGDGYRQVLRGLGPMSTILHLDLATVFASVEGCYSLINVSHPEDADQKPATFYHTSFSDFLVDSTRSRNFYISLEEVEDDILQSSLNIWQDFKTSHPTIPGLTYQTRWLEYLSAIVQLERWSYFNIQRQLYWYIHEALCFFLVEKHNPKAERLFFSEEDQQQCLNLLSQLEHTTLCEGFCIVNKLPEFLLWLFDIWEIHQEELISSGVLQKVGLEQAQFSQLGTCPAYTCITQGKSDLNHLSWNEARFGTLLRDISHLESRFPQLPVFACWHQGQGCLLFRHQADASDLQKYGLNSSITSNKVPIWQFFVLLYSPSNFDHFFKANLETIQASNPQAVHSIQPSAKQFLRLRDIASHQPLFAKLAIQFIEDPQFGDSLTCLNQLLAFIDNIDPSNDQPFVYVDALYTHILGFIPSDIWPKTQKVLGALYYGVTNHDSSLRSPKSVSIVLGIELRMVYTALSCCSAMVLIPPESVSLGSMAFYHSSFCEYLMDSTQSHMFYISMKNVKDHILKQLINIWQDFKQFQGVHGDYISKWNNYCSQYHPDADTSDYSLVADFNFRFLCDAHNALFVSMTQYDPAKLKSKQVQDHIFQMLRQLDFMSIHMGFQWWYKSEFVLWLLGIWNTYQTELTSRSLVQEITFQELQFDHLRHHNVFYHTLLCNVSDSIQIFLAKRITTPEELEAYKSGLELFQQHRPQLRVLVAGSPGGRFAIFEYEYTEDDLKAWSHHPRDRALKAGDQGHYIFSYPNSV